MFVVKVGDRLYGPFKTATLAAKWAPAHLASGAVWQIVPVSKP